ncbi:hypothetical protein [Novosphingobium sp. 9]|uniref:hypothetical protein n=1 Tax=Novosphingobium sp. 9 TaxID=2025349 RepID=UPI0021B543EE|nr:hypothetical protein [Novosphingobium sp. 9]
MTWRDTLQASAPYTAPIAGGLLLLAWVDIIAAPAFIEDAAVFLALPLWLILIALYLRSALKPDGVATNTRITVAGRTICALVGITCGYMLYAGDWHTGRELALPLVMLSAQIALASRTFSPALPEGTSQTPSY